MSISKSHVQDILRAPEFPPIPGLNQEAQDYLTRYQKALNQQLQYLHNCCLVSDTVAVAGSVSSHVFTWPIPAPTNLYFAAFEVNWKTIIEITAQTTTTVTVDFGTNSPPGGGFIRALRVL